MNKKNLIILCVIFAILISLVFVKRSMKPSVPTKEEIVDIITQPVGIDQFSEIALRLGDGNSEDAAKPKNVHLAKEGDKWIVKTQYGIYADNNAITSLLDRLDQLKGELRSDRKELLGDYGIGDSEGVHVELNQEGTKGLHVVVGVKKAGFQNNFVRLAESNAVYVVNENLLGVLGLQGEKEEQKLDAQKWVDKRIAHVVTDNVAGVAVMQVINGVQETVVDIRKNTVDDKKQWQSVTPYAFTLDASKIKSMVEKFNTTYARDIIAPDAQGVFDAPGWTGTFTMEDGSEYKLVRGAKDEKGENYYVKSEGAGYFYLVPVSTFDTREKQQGDIFAANPLKVEDGKVTSIEVNDMESKKKFNVTKTLAPQAPKEEGAAEEKAQEEIVWKAANGETVDTSKVNGVIEKIKNINVEVIAKSITAKGIMTVKITNEEGMKEYAVSDKKTLENGKECHILTVSGDSQGYCVSPDQVKALKEALP